jgi:hypothetical protein
MSIGTVVTRGYLATTGTIGYVVTRGYDEGAGPPITVNVQNLSPGSNVPGAVGKGKPKGKAPYFRKTGNSPYPDPTPPVPSPRMTSSENTTTPPNVIAAPFVAPKAPFVAQIAPFVSPMAPIVSPDPQIVPPHHGAAFALALFLHDLHDW